MATTEAPFAEISWNLGDNHGTFQNILEPSSLETPTINNISHVLLMLTNQTTATTPNESTDIFQSQNASVEAPSSRKRLCPEHNNLADVFDTVGILLIVAMGIFGNGLSFIILRLQSKKSTMNRMMMILALVDNLYLLGVFIVYILGSKAPQYNLVRRNVAVVARIFQFLSVWMIIIIGIIRLLAIRHPLKVKVICTARRSLFAVLIVFLLDIFIHIPQFNFEFPVWKIPRFKHIYFAIIYNFLMMYLVPFAILIIINVLLLKSLCSNNTQQLHETKHLQPQENRDITKVVIAIITTFIVAYSGYAFAALLSISPTLYAAFIKNGTCFHMWILHFFQMCCYINSSVNFFIYFFLRKSFRKNLKRLLPDRPSSRRESETSCNTPILTLI